MEDEGRADDTPDEEVPEGDAAASAADLPTAVWDDSVLRDIGLVGGTARPSDPAPATRPEGQSRESSIQIADDPEAASSSSGSTRSRSRKVPAWLPVIACAAAAGVASYLLIRLLLS